MDTDNKRAGFETARLALSRLRLGTAESQQESLVHVLRIASRALACDHVGIWLFEGEGLAERLTAKLVYRVQDDEVTSGDVLTRAAFPSYWAALKERRAIVADDALCHPATRELAESYLRPMGVGAMLDVPLYRNGEVVGVVCHEAKGPAREWSQVCIDFGSSVADLVSLLLAQSERLALEQELRVRIARLRDVDRLETMGRVANAVAHDVNNVMTAVGIAAVRLKHKHPELAELGETLRVCAETGAHLTQRLSAFAGRPSRSEGGARVDAVIADVRHMIELLLRGVGALTVEVEAEDPRVTATGGAIEQIVMNLCLNARDALAAHDGDAPGRIDVHVRDAKIGQGERPAIAIVVEDNGPGIPAALQSQVFNLGYTTKATGSGIGLATVRDLAREAGGDITVATSLLGGAKFTVTLPAVVRTDDTTQTLSPV